MCAPPKLQQKALWTPSKSRFCISGFFCIFFLFHGILYGALLHFSSPNSEYPDRRNPKQIAQTMNHLPFVGGQRIVLLQADEEGEPAGNLAAPLSPPATGPRPSSPPPHFSSHSNVSRPRPFLGAQSPPHFPSGPPTSRTASRGRWDPVSPLPKCRRGVVRGPRHRCGRSPAAVTPTAKHLQQQFPTNLDNTANFLQQGMIE